MIDRITKSIVKRELKGYFSTPVGYVFVVIFLFSIGYVTFEPGRGSFFILRQADLASFFRYIPWLFIFLVPAISMRLWSEERKTGTIELLLTSPVTLSQAVIGKFLAAWIFLIFVLLCTFPMIITVIYLGNPDLGTIYIGYLGAILMAGTYLAVGMFFSAMTRNQVISFIMSVVGCYLLLMAGSPPILEFLSSFTPLYVVDVFESLSILNHFEAMGRGVVRLGDLLFFSITIIGWLYLSVILLREKKSC